MIVDNTTQPLPTKGMVLALLAISAAGLMRGIGSGTHIIFISRTVTLKGSDAIYTIDAATCVASKVGSGAIIPLGCNAP
jgi:hypothetical protein